MKIILYLSIFILFLSCEKEKVGKNVLSQELESKLVSKLSERGIFQAWGLIKQGICLKWNIWTANNRRG